MSKTADNLQLNISVMFLKEGKTFVAYSPALDLSTCGSTMEEAKQMFSEAVGIFFDELETMGTTHEVLSSLGWTKKRGSKQLEPPTIIGNTLESVRVPLVV